MVVCTGNACRSPMAEGFLREYLKPEKGFEIISSGISAIKGVLPTSEAVKVMQEEGIDISSYGSTPFSDEEAQGCDIILVMAKMHRDFILRNMPALAGKIFLYKYFSGIDVENKDIIDPIGQPLSTYKAVRDEIKLASKAIVGKLVSAAGESASG